MKRGRNETSPSPTRLGHDVHIDIPLDLTVEILKKLPTKSLMRFQCVSKLWSSIISSRRDFIDSIMTRSLTQPPRDVHLMYHHDSGRSFLALISATDMELELVPGEYHLYCQSVRGLICKLHTFSSICKVVVTVYNPTTRQSINLPELKTESTFVFSKTTSNFLFGYDPLENQYKVVFLPGYDNKSCRVFTLGDPTAKFWRPIQGVDRPLVARGSVVCINGTIYYLARGRADMEDNQLMSFDVRSEKFDYVDVPKNILIQMDCDPVPINYQGKVGFLLCCEKDLAIWAMERKVWSKIFFCEVGGFQGLRFSGATHRGEIVFYHWPDTYPWRPASKLRLFYYDPNRNSMRCVSFKDYYKVNERMRCVSFQDYYKVNESNKIHCVSFEDYCKVNESHQIHLSTTSTVVWTVPDYVENTMRLK